MFLPLALGDKFFGLLRASTLLLDPFPFGGGVTTLEAFSVCRLVVTAPALQSVVALAAGFYRRLGVADAPIVDSVDAYVERAQSLAADAVRRVRSRPPSAAPTGIYSMMTSPWRSGRRSCGARA